MKEIWTHGDSQKIVIKHYNNVVEMSKHTRRMTTLEAWMIGSTLVFPSAFLLDVIKALTELLPVEDDESHDESVGDEVRISTASVGGKEVKNSG